MNETFFHRYIIKPFYLLIRNWTIFLLFFIFLIISNVYAKYSNIDLKINATSIYNNLPSSLLSLFANKLTATILFVCFLIMSYLIVGIGKDMLMIFTRQRKNLFHSMRHIALSNVIWFLKLEFYLYLLFGLIALFFYGLTFFVWKSTRMELVPIIILGCAFAFLYPFFYIGLSLGSMFSVLPISSSEKFKKIKYFLPVRTLFATYLFYSARLFIEYVFIIGLPFISIYFFKNLILANAFAILGLVFPLLLLRVSAYEFKLGILKNDADIQTIFHQHFHSDGKSDE
jgi:hypothetical protein